MHGPVYSLRKLPVVAFHSAKNIALRSAISCTNSCHALRFADLLPETSRAAQALQVLAQQLRRPPIILPRQLPRSAPLVVRCLAAPQLHNVAVSFLLGSWTGLSGFCRS